MLISRATSVIPPPPKGERERRGDEKGREPAERPSRRPQPAWGEREWREAGDLAVEEARGRGEIDRDPRAPMGKGPRDRDPDPEPEAGTITMLPNPMNIPK